MDEYAGLQLTCGRKLVDATWGELGEELALLREACELLRAAVAGWNPQAAPVSLAGMRRLLATELLLEAWRQVVGRAVRMRHAEDSAAAAVEAAFGKTATLSITVQTYVGFNPCTVAVTAEAGRAYAWRVAGTGGAARAAGRGCPTPKAALAAARAALGTAATTG